MELATWIALPSPNDVRVDDFDPFGDAPRAVNWATLSAEEAMTAWRELDAWVTWLKTSFGLPPGIIPPLWHRHDELVWELSGLHTHWMSCHDEAAPPSAPLSWLRDFADARARLREWVATSGTRLDRDRPTRRTPWPGEHPADAGTNVEAEIHDREEDFDEFVRQDLLRRRRMHALAATSDSSWSG